MSYLNLHPDINNGLTKGSPDFAGGILYCHCSTNPIKIQIKGNVLHNHACGCSKCWKPGSALFSIVGVVPTENLTVLSNEDKLRIVDHNAPIQRNACRECGVHMFGRIVKDHPFKGLDFIHVELSSEDGWQEPQFAAFVSSIIEQGFDAGKMDEVRGKFRSIGLETYDCLSPALMDAIAAYTAKSKLTSEQTQAVTEEQGEGSGERRDSTVTDRSTRSWGRLWKALGIVKRQKSSSKL